MALQLPVVWHNKQKPTMKYISLFLIVLVLFFSSCSKEVDDITIDIPEKIGDLKVDDGFSWSTGVPVEVTVTGLPTIVPVRSTLTVSQPDGRILHTRNHLMSDNLVIQLTVPADVTELIVNYGTVELTAVVAGGNASFSFIPVSVN